MEIKLKFVVSLICFLGLAVHAKAKADCGPEDHVENSVYGLSDFSRCVKLTDGLVLRWKLPAKNPSDGQQGTKEIVLAAQFPTSNGWVGLGFGEGSMLGSDIVSIRKVNDKWISEDRLGISTSTPPLDAQQDFHLVAAEAKNGHTWFKISRAVTTCDKAGGDWDFDFNFETPVIWAFGSSYDFAYHGMKRGTGMVRFSDIAAGPPPTMPADVKEFVIMPQRSISVPSTDTTQYCYSGHILPSDQEYHVLAYEPIINGTHPENVHHIELYRCVGDSDADALVGKNVCNSQEARGSCYIFWMIWNFGVGRLDFPDVAGMKMGKGGATKIVMEVHYNNPTRIPNIVDQSGLRLFYSPTLRKHNAVQWTLGSMNFNIPPGKRDALIKDECPSDCTAKMPHEVIIFSTLLHMHKFGRRMRVRHIRGNVELPDISRTDHYDFRRQEPDFKQGVVVKPGDRILVECYYDTTSTPKYTHFGRSTLEEMCFAFITLYPDPQLLACGDFAKVGDKQTSVCVLESQKSLFQPAFNARISPASTIAAGMQALLPVLMDTTVSSSAPFTPYIDAKCPNSPLAPSVDVQAIPGGRDGDHDAMIPAWLQESKVMLALGFMALVGVAAAGYAAGKLAGIKTQTSSADAFKHGDKSEILHVKRDQEGTDTHYQHMDGLRGVGVLCVVFYHLGWSAFANAWMFVGFFFSLSGLLITDVTVRVLERKGSVELVRFWARRMARLLPALLLVVTVICVYTMASVLGIFGEKATPTPQQLFLLRWDLLWAIGYGENMHLITASSDYFSKLEKASIVRHLWSVAIEEQYYLVWPVLFVIWTSFMFPVTAKAPSSSSSPSSSGEQRDGAEELEMLNQDQDGSIEPNEPYDNDSAESGRVRSKEDLAVKRRQASLNVSLRALACGELAVLIGSYFISLSILTDEGPSAAYYSTISRSGEFAAGGLVYVIVRLNPSLHNRYKHLPGLPAMSTNFRIILELLAAAQIGLLFTSAVMGACGIIVEIPFYFRYIRLPLSLSLAVLTIPGALQLSEPLPKWAVVCRTLTSKTMVFLGVISYSIYLFHWPLVWWFGEVEGDVFSADPDPNSKDAAKLENKAYIITRDLGIVVASVAMASALFLWYEKPVMQAARGLKPSRVLAIALLISAFVAVLVVVVTWKAVDPALIDPSNNWEQNADAMSIINMIPAGGAAAPASAAPPPVTP